MYIYYNLLDICNKCNNLYCNNCIYSNQCNICNFKELINYDLYNYYSNQYPLNRNFKTYDIYYGYGKLGLNISVSPKLKLPIIVKKNNQINKLYNQLLEPNDILYSINDVKCFEKDCVDIINIINEISKPFKITFIKNNNNNLCKIPHIYDYFYFEVKIINLIDNISIGISPQFSSYSSIIESHVGQYIGSIGYISNGIINNLNKNYDKYFNNDIIGCGICLDYDLYFFVKNGKLINNGRIYSLCNCEYYPCISIENNNTIIDINYGDKPFLYSKPYKYINIYNESNYINNNLKIDNIKIIIKYLKDDKKILEGINLILNSKNIIDEIIKSDILRILVELFNSNILFNNIILFYSIIYLLYYSDDKKREKIINKNYCLLINYMKLNIIDILKNYEYYIYSINLVNILISQNNNDDDIYSIINIHLEKFNSQYNLYKDSNKIIEILLEIILKCINLNKFKLLNIKYIQLFYHIILNSNIQNLIISCLDLIILLSNNSNFISFMISQFIDNNSLFNDLIYLENSKNTDINKSISIINYIIKNSDKDCNINIKTLYILYDTIENNDNELLIIECLFSIYKILLNNIDKLSDYDNLFKLVEMINNKYINMTYNEYIINILLLTTELINIDVLFIKYNIIPTLFKTLESNHYNKGILEIIYNLIEIYPSIRKEILKNNPFSIPLKLLKENDKIDIITIVLGIIYYLSLEYDKVEKDIITDYIIMFKSLLLFNNINDNIFKDFLNVINDIYNNNVKNNKIIFYYLQINHIFINDNYYSSFVINSKFINILLKYIENNPNNNIVNEEYIEILTNILPKTQSGHINFSYLSQNSIKRISYNILLDIFQKDDVYSIIEICHMNSELLYSYYNIKKSLQFDEYIYKLFMNYNNNLYNLLLIKDDDIFEEKYINKLLCYYKHPFIEMKLFLLINHIYNPLIQGNLLKFNIINLFYEKEINSSYDSLISNIISSNENDIIWGIYCNNNILSNIKYNLTCLILKYPCINTLIIDFKDVKQISFFSIPYTITNLILFNCKKQVMETILLFLLNYVSSGLYFNGLSINNSKTPINLLSNYLSVLSLLTDDIKWLNLSSNNLYDNDIFNIFSEINLKINSLFLSHNNLHDLNKNNISYVWKNLKILDISYNNLSDSFIYKLLYELKKSNQLETLVVSYNNINLSDESFYSFLTNNTCLTYLNISGNVINKLSIERISNCLKQCSSILFLICNDIDTITDEIVLLWRNILKNNLLFNKSKIRRNLDEISYFNNHRIMKNFSNYHYISNDNSTNNINKSESTCKIGVFISSPLVYKDINNELHSISEINYKDEIDSFYNTLSNINKPIELLFDYIRIDRLRSYITKGCNVYHFIFHCSKKNIYLEDNNLGLNSISINEFANLFRVENRRSNDIYLIFLSACNSKILGYQLISLGIPYVICVDNDKFVTDSAALKFTNFFYQSLFENKYSIYDAYNIASSIQKSDFIILSESYLLSGTLFSHIKSKTGKCILQKRSTNKLPSLPEFFFGRNIEIYEIICSSLKRKLTIINGIEGIGKSSVIKSACIKMEERGLFIDGIFYIDLSHNIKDINSKLCKIFNIEYKDNIEDIVLEIKDKNMLLIFDHIQNKSYEDINQLIKLLVNLTNDIHIIYITINKILEITGCIPSLIVIKQLSISDTIQLILLALSINFDSTTLLKYKVFLQKSNEIKKLDGNPKLIIKYIKEIKKDDLINNIKIQNQCI